MRTTPIDFIIGATIITSPRTTFRSYFILMGPTRTITARGILPTKSITTCWRTVAVWFSTPLGKSPTGTKGWSWTRPRTKGRSVVYGAFGNKGPFFVNKKNPKPKDLGSTVLGWKTGFEPATSGTTIQRSNQLSYNHHLKRMQKYFIVSIKPNNFGFWT